MKPTGVNSGACHLKVQYIIPKSNLLKFNFPVCLTAHRDIGDATNVRAVVDTTKCGLTTIILGITKAEREDRLVHEALVDHVVEGRYYTIDRYGIVGKAENAIEPGSCVNHGSLII
jgi:hypothetical protein